MFMRRKKIGKTGEQQRISDKNREENDKLIDVEPDFKELKEESRFKRLTNNIRRKSRRSNKKNEECKKFETECDSTSEQKNQPITDLDSDEAKDRADVMDMDNSFYPELQADLEEDEDIEMGLPHKIGNFFRSIPRMSMKSRSKKATDGSILRASDRSNDSAYASFSEKRGKKLEHKRDDTVEELTPDWQDVPDASGDICNDSPKEESFFRRSYRFIRAIGSRTSNHSFDSGFGSFFGKKGQPRLLNNKFPLNKGIEGQTNSAYEEIGRQTNLVCFDIEQLQRPAEATNIDAALQSSGQCNEEAEQGTVASVANEGAEQGAVESESNKARKSVPKDLLKRIKMCMRAENISSFQVFHLPDDIHKIMIYGIGVTRAQTNIDRILSNNQQFQKFTAATVEESVSLKDSWINWFNDPQPYLVQRENTQLSSVELVVSAMDEKCSGITSPDFYILPSGHTFLNERERLAAATGENSLEVFENISRKTWYSRPYVLAPCGRKIDIKERPLPAYKYFYPCHPNDEEFIAYDMAMCKVDRNQLRRILYTGPRHRLETHTYDHTIVEPMVNITTGSQLRNYEGRKVLCCNKRGTIQPQTATQINGRIVGSLIAFTLDDHERLFVGHSGLIVYLIDENDETKLQRYGQLVGSLGTEPRIYLATPISYGIERIANDTRLLVRDISPMNSLRYSNTDSVTPVQETAGTNRFQQATDMV